MLKLNNHLSKPWKIHITIRREGGRGRKGGREGEEGREEGERGRERGREGSEVKKGTYSICLLRCSTGGLMCNVI